MQNDLWLDIAREAYEAQQQEQIYAQRKSELLSKLKVLSGNKSTTQGQYVFMMSERKGSIDYISIPELQSIDLEVYRNKPVIVWKLMKVE